MPERGDGASCLRWATRHTKMKKKTIVTDYTTYVLGELSFGEGRKLFGGSTPSDAIPTQLLMFSLNRGDDGSRTAEDIEKLPYSHGMELLGEAYELNGVHKAKPGEAQPAQTPAK